MAKLKNQILQMASHCTTSFYNQVQMQRNRLMVVKCEQNTGTTQQDDKLQQL